MREESESCGSCGYYFKNILKFLLSHIGLVSLVVGYTIVGALLFSTLEAEAERKVKSEMQTERVKVTNRLWEIAENMSYLEEVKWSEGAKQALCEFETILITAIKEKGWDGREDVDEIRWTFAGALFYSIILITTIGYGHISPKTEMGKVMTIFYAIPGVPLMMLCLANIGDGMAHSFRFLYWKVCCYACTKRPKRRRRPRSTPYRTPSSRSRYSENNRARPSSFRKPGRGSQRSQRSNDSQLNDCYYPYPDAGFKRYEPSLEAIDDRRPGPMPHVSRHEDRRIRDEDRTSKTPMGSLSRTKNPSNRPTEQNNTTKDGENVEDDKKSAVLYNKYAIEQDDGPTEHRNETRNENEVLKKPVPGRDSLDRDLTEPNEPHKERPRLPPRERGSDPDAIPKHLRLPPSGRGMMSEPPLDPPYRGDSGYYSRQMGPPDNRSRLSAMEEQYYYDDEYYDDYDDNIDMDDHSDKPVPIWLGVMLVVLYIIGGALLFSRWENWLFLDSVYFCFITLTTIGFGDFVPAQTTNGKEKDTQLSIALCSIYLLFGIALLAMSFNLVQEEVISNVKTVAKRLGIIKEEEEEED